MQMGGAAALAVNIYGAFGDTASGFAASYAFVRFVLVVEYYRQLRKKSAAESKKPYRPLVKRYITGFSCAATIWLVSAFIPELEIRLLFWAVALMVDFATPITAGKLHSKFAPHVSHLPERMGLFTIIVLGESIVGVITGMADHVWNIHSVAVVSLGLCISFSLWWLCFSNAKSSPIQDLREKTKIGVYYAWLYGHFPLVVAITALGAGIGHLVSAEQGQIIKPADLWLICISVALALMAQSIIHISSTEINQTESTKRGKLTFLGRYQSYLYPEFPC